MFDSTLIINYYYHLKMTRTAHYNSVYSLLYFRFLSSLSSYSSSLSSSSSYYYYNLYSTFYSVVFSLMIIFKLKLTKNKKNYKNTHKLTLARWIVESLMGIKSRMWSLCIGFGFFPFQNRPEEFTLWKLQNTNTHCVCVCDVCVRGLEPYQN